MTWLAVLGVGFLLILSFGISGAFSIVQTYQIINLPGFLITNGRSFSFLTAWLVFALLYKYVPNTKTWWADTLLGAFITAVMFTALKDGFILYLNFANYEKVYGPIASVKVALVFVYFSAIILVLGAKFTCVYGHMRRGSGHGKPVTGILTI